jgi:hypothetical protein
MSESQVKHHIDDYTAELFRAYIGQRFIFRLPESAVAACGPMLDLVLVEVNENERISKSAARRQSKSGRPVRVPFSILFRGDRENRLSSGLLPLQHEDFEEFPVFLSRILLLPGDSEEEDKPHYEAVFA